MLEMVTFYKCMKYYLLTAYTFIKNKKNIGYQNLERKTFCVSKTQNCASMFTALYMTYFMIWVCFR